MELTVESKQYTDVENMGTDILLSIIIPVYNNANFTKSALNDLIKLPSNHEIIIVDNGSTDETAIMVNEITTTLPVNSPKIIYIGCPKNLGFGRANNKGYKHATGKNILFLNNDIRVKNDYATWTNILIQECQQGKLVSANGGLLNDGFNFIRETDKLVTSEYFYLSGWCLAGSRETFDKLILDIFSDDRTDEIKLGKAWGPWNERFFAYFEDDDLTWRAVEMGIPLSVVKIPVHHFGSVTARKVGLSKMYKTSQELFNEAWAGKLKK